MIDHDTSREPKEDLLHPIHIALNWQRDLAANKDLTMAKIARNKGISRARVSQIMSLLNLPETVRKALAALIEPEEIRFFSERRLRGLLSANSDPDRVKAFQKLRAHFEVSCAR